MSGRENENARKFNELARSDQPVAARQCRLNEHGMLGP